MTSPEAKFQVASPTKISLGYLVKQDRFGLVDCCKTVANVRNLLMRKNQKFAIEKSETFGRLLVVYISLQLENRNSFI